MLMFRVMLAVRENPWARALLGGVLAVLGVVWIVVGAGHGRLAAVGALMLVGGVAGGVRALRASKQAGEPDDARDETTSPEP